MSSTMNDTIGTAKHVMDSARDVAERGAAGARSTWMDGVKTALSAAVMLRSIGLDDALRFVGLSRRRDPLTSVALLGAGVAVGVGIGMLLAPTTGEELRRSLRARFMGLKDDVKQTAERVESGVKDAGEKAEEIAGKAKDAARKAEQKLEDKVGERAETRSNVGGQRAHEHSSKAPS